MRSIFYLVGQSLKRRRMRTCVMLVSITLACAALFVAAVLSRGVQDTLKTASERFGADIVVVPADAVVEAQSALIAGNPTSFYMPATHEEKIAAVEGVEKTCPQVFLRSLDAPCCVSQVALIGFEPERDITIAPWMLQKLGGYLQDNQIIVGAKVISAVVGTPSKAIGQRLVFMGKPFTVATILEPTGMGTDFTVFITMDTAYRLMQGSPLYPVPVTRDQISAVFIKTAKGADIHAVARAVEASVPGTAAIPADQLTRTVGKELSGVIEVVYVVSLVFLVLAAGLVATLFTLSVRQRLREFGLFRAMGATCGLVSRLIVAEAAFVAGLGALLGTLVGLGLSFGFRGRVMAATGDLYTWPEPSFFAYVGLACVGGALLVGILGGIFPARMAARLDPYESIRKGA